MDRPSEKVELFETFEVEQVASQVRQGSSPYYEDCYWCFYKL